MESSLAFLCLWICFIVYASTSNGCSEIPVVENAEVAESSKKKHYSDDDTLDYNCGHGYVSLIKIIYTCRNNKWIKLRGEKCSLKRCESPEDIPNGRYTISSGRTFVFGTTIKYICNDGYQIMSRFDTRTCRDGGWDNQLPACEEVACERKTAEGNIRMEGLPDHPEDLIRYGHRLTFSCVGELILRGPKEITCQSNGEWSSPFPKCVEVTCEGEELINVDILTGHPGIAPPYKPGQVLVFRCTDVNLKMQGQRVIECLSSGKWDHPYPKCGDSRCEVPSDQHVSRTYDSFRGDMKLGARRSYICESGYEKMAAEATCTEDGWTPKPLCAKSSCEAPRDQNVYAPYEYFRGDMKLGSKLYYACESGYEKMAEEATCTRDGWTPKPLCAVMTVSAKCGPPPHVNNADTVEMTKKEYNTGERVEYKCFNKYTLYQQPPFTKYLTCQQGQWRGNIKCLKPCTVTKELMAERGIDLAYAEQQKLFAEHNDHITFVCLKGRVSVGTDFRQKCNDGEITLPECV